MSRRLLVYDKLEDFKRDFPEYSFGQVMYAALSRLKLEDGKEFKKSTFLDIKDGDFYKALCQAYVFEKEAKKDSK